LLITKDSGVQASSPSVTYSLEMMSIKKFFFFLKFLLTRGCFFAQVVFQA
jgi:hypothetical protein